ncbi:unnamed protein product [Rangifer tarandus platyrhynchus]|uniref:Uncharacterized protein n=1 Tax=Rangifer tarandus platyrhynchus TaxID=3082113 RepID=A0AC59YIN9_RANTA
MTTWALAELEVRFSSLDSCTVPVSSTQDLLVMASTTPGQLEEEQSPNPGRVMAARRGRDSQGQATPCPSTFLGGLADTRSYSWIEWGCRASGKHQLVIVKPCEAQCPGVPVVPLAHDSLPKGFTVPCKEGASSRPAGPSQAPASSSLRKLLALLANWCASQAFRGWAPFPDRILPAGEAESSSRCQRAFSGQVGKLSSPTWEEVPSEI